MPVVPPAQISAYSWKTVATDLADLLDHLGIKDAVFIGHDWGGMIVWRMVNMRSERVKAVARLILAHRRFDFIAVLVLTLMACSFCTAYAPPARRYVPLDDLVKMLPQWKYQVRSGSC